jgi:hypothetical protein
VTAPWTPTIQHNVGALVHAMLAFWCIAADRQVLCIAAQDTICIAPSQCNCVAMLPVQKSTATVTLPVPPRELG